MRGVRLCREWIAAQEKALQRHVAALRDTAVAKAEALRPRVVAAVDAAAARVDALRPRVNALREAVAAQTKALRPKAAALRDAAVAEAEALRPRVTATAEAVATWVEARRPKVTAAMAAAAAQKKALRPKVVAALSSVGAWGKVMRRKVTRVSIPDWARVAGAAVVALAVILGMGIGLGRLHLDPSSLHAEKPVATKTSAPPQAETRADAKAEAKAPDLQPAAVQMELAQQVVPLAWLNPITGPDQPPLPEDEHGPSGSRRTTGTPEVALTFDDGPDPRWTPEVLALLRQYHIKATFCVIGVNVAEFPELVRQIVSEGHTLCNHSWIHDLTLGNRGKAAILSDLSRTNDAIHAAAPHARVSYYRQPGGAWTRTVVESARQLGMTSLHWDVDPKDWLKPGPRAISTTVTTGTLPGAIVLMHDGGGDRRGTVDALRTILPNLTARFSLVALPPGIDQPRMWGIQLPVHLGQE